MANTDVEETYWEVLGRAHNLPPEAIIQIYSLWDSRETPKFSDFVDEMKLEAEKIRV